MKTPKTIPDEHYEHDLDLPDDTYSRYPADRKQKQRAMIDRLKKVQKEK